MPSRYSSGVRIFHRVHQLNQGCSPPRCACKKFVLMLPKFSLKSITKNNSATLQGAISDFFKWTKSLDLSLTIPKCKVMHCGKRNRAFSYYIDRQLLESTETIRDLGVLMSDDMRYTEHTSDVVYGATRRTSFVLRSVIISRPEVYYKLLDTYISAIITCGSPAWSPT